MTFLLNICLLNTNQQKFCLKLFTTTLTMNKKQEIFLKFNKVVTKNQACLEKS